MTINTDRPWLLTDTDEGFRLLEYVSHILPSEMPW